MEPLVDSTVMDATWRAVGGSSHVDIRRMQKQYAKGQEEQQASSLDLRQI
jgi:hypothetical protein